MKMRVEEILPSSVDLKGTFLVGIISVKRCPPLPNAVLWCNNRPRVKTPRSFSRRRLNTSHIYLWFLCYGSLQSSMLKHHEMEVSKSALPYISRTISEIQILNTVELILEGKNCWFKSWKQQSRAPESFQSRTITIRCRQTALSHPGPSQLWW